MKILIVGAGAIGGYFGARLMAAGRDVTFLVRPRRASRLQDHGLRVHSPHGNLAFDDPKLVLREALSEQSVGPFALVLLSCKAWDLDDAIESCAAAVGPETLVLPLLNGMRHLDSLQARFGARVIGGQCSIGATLDAQGNVQHLNRHHSLVFGALEDGQRQAVSRVAPLLLEAGFEGRCSDEIRLEMWEKWVMLATLACGTTLMRAAIGDINSTPDGRMLLDGLLAETTAIATVNGFPPREAQLAAARAMLSDSGSRLTASMYRDMQHQGPIEADHVVGDLIERAGSLEAIRLRIAYAGLKAYETQRARSSAGS